MDVIGHCNWTIYNGDGENELICNCTYGDDGAQRVFIFRNNAGIIEVGSFDETRMASEIGEELSAISYNVFYDEAQKSIVFVYITGHEYSILPDDFSFSNYVPGEAI